jgi:hypothetical protein
MLRSVSVYRVHHLLVWNPDLLEVKRSKSGETVKHGNRENGNVGSCERDPLHVLINKRNGNPSQVDHHGKN